jgi:peroxiredoxin
MEAGLLTCALYGYMRVLVMMQKFTATVLLLAFANFALGAPPSPVPRKSPDFTVYEPSGQQTQLSSLRGKVVVIEFFFLRSPKCLDLAKTLNRLNSQLGSRGFQALAVAFAAPGSDANGPLVTEMVNYFKIAYPVGYTNKEKVDEYLGRSGGELLRIPQVVVIDRTGMIRAQSGGRDGNVQLENETYLRALLEDLLREPSRMNAKQSK